MRFAVPVPPVTGVEAADAAAFAAWEAARERHYHPECFGLAGERLPARGLTFYLGVPEPSWLAFGDGVPMFVSASRFDRYQTRGDRWPVTSATRYAIDSGAYIALDGTNEDVPWWNRAETYASKIEAFAVDCGRPPEFCAPQDWPCEPVVRRRTGMTVREHQQATLDSFLFLSTEFPAVPWIPVLQGWEPGEHAEHAVMYADAGVDLARCHRVGVGSVCRRAHLPEIVEVIGQLADSGLRLHGFGLKKTALPLVGHLLTSADSMAWSFDARYTPVRMPGCTHLKCSSCYRYAKHWREEVLASMSEGKKTMPTTRTPRRRPKAAAATGGLIAGLEGLFEAAAQAGTVALTDVQIGRYVSVSGAQASWLVAPNGTLHVPAPRTTVEMRGYVVHAAGWTGGVKLGKADAKAESAVGALVALADQPDVDWLLNHDQVRLAYLPAGGRVTLVDEPAEPVRTGSAKKWMTDSLVHRAEGILAAVHPGENVVWAAAVVTHAEAWQIATIIEGGETLMIADSEGCRPVEGWQRPLGYVKRFLSTHIRDDKVQVLTERDGDVLVEVTGEQIRDLILDLLDHAPDSAGELLAAYQQYGRAHAVDAEQQRRKGPRTAERQAEIRAAYAALRRALDRCSAAADQFWQDAEVYAATLTVPAVPAAAAPIDLRAMREEALAVIAHYEPGRTLHKLLYWALGVLHFSRPDDLWSRWHCGDQMWTPSSKDAFGQGSAGRWIHGTRDYWEIYEGASTAEQRSKTRPMASGIWSDVTGLITVFSVPAGLRAELDEVMDARQDLAVDAGPDERQQVEDRGLQVAARMWYAVKPTALWHSPPHPAAKPVAPAPSGGLLDLDALGEVGEAEPEAVGLLDLDAVDDAMEQLELDLGDLFGAAAAEPAPEPVRDVRAEAREVLEGFRKGDKVTPLMRWAAGVVQMGHVLHLVAWWDDKNMNEVYLTSNQYCGAGMAWKSDRRSFQMAERDSGDVMVERPVLTITWGPVLRMVLESNVPAQLVARARAALVERVAATPVYDPSGMRSKTDPVGHKADQERQSAAEREAYAAALAVWDAVRPT